MKKMVKAIALALALCMVLSVSAFAAVGETGKTVDTAVHTVDFTVTGVAEGEQVALLVLVPGTAVADADEETILFIDQQAATANGAAFNATIAEGNDVVDVWVGSSTISSEKAGAWKVYENVEVAETSSITFVTDGKIILNVDEDTERPGAAVLATVNKVDIDKMIWSIVNEDDLRLYSKALDVDYTGLDGNIWFTGVFTSASDKFSTIKDVALLFHGTDGETYYVNVDKEIADAARETN